HFIGMLAFIMPIPLSYDIGLTTVSLLVAILVTGGGFYVISRRSPSPLRLVLSGIFMGLGIAAMHYTGMAAMRGRAELSYDRLFVALSLVIAIGASTAALWLAFRTTDLWQKLAAAVVMGLAISGMHYTAMRAAMFVVHGPIAEARAAAMRMVKDGTRAAEIISRIRLLFNKGTPQREWVDVNEVIREIIVLLRGELARYAISVRPELAADLPRLMGDRVQLQQVMMNL